MKTSSLMSDVWINDGLTLITEPQPDTMYSKVEMSELFHGALGTSPFLHKHINPEVICPSGGQPYEFSMCLAEKQDGQNLSPHLLLRRRKGLLKVLYTALTSGFLFSKIPGYSKVL